MLILATTFVQLFNLFSPKALWAWVNVFYCFCRNEKLLFFWLERLPKILSVTRIERNSII